MKGAASREGPRSAGCGQLPLTAAASLQSPSCAAREEQDEGKPEPDDQDGRGQLTPLLSSRNALSLAGLSRCRVRARLHLLSGLGGWKCFSLKERNHVVNKQGILEIGRRNRR